jgi:ribulose-5-phosphate 4-epimerase/fuculose-1-phosphate aldolase
MAAIEAARGAREDAVWRARVDLAAAYRLAARYGYNEGVCNHFTLMLPGEADKFLLIPHGVHWSQVRASRLLVVDFAGNVVQGKGDAEATAFYIHARIHRQAPHAACVLHTHQPYATALTMLEDMELKPSIQSALRFYGRIAYDEVYSGLALDEAEGDRMARRLGDKEVLFSANHGVLVAGPSVAQAFDALYFLERAAQAQIIALSSGQKLRQVSPNLAASVNAQMMADVPKYAAAHFDALKQILDKEEPDYAT